jgi:hypothetical protein
MEFKAGTVFWMKPPRTAKPHVFFVLTDPTPEGTVLIANMTTLRGTVEDRSCILGPGDDPAVQCPSAMRYDQAANAPVAKLAEAESRGLLTPHRDASPELLARIIAGAQASPDLNPSLRALLPDRAAALPPQLDARTDAPA